MPGTFRYPFGDDDTTGFFGGYRPLAARLPSDTDNQSAPVPTSEPAAVPTDVLIYPNGEIVLDSKQRPYPRPPGFDMQSNLAVGDDINQSVAASKNTFDPVDRDFWFAPHFIAGASMDYKRPGGILGPYEKEFRPASYYNYGVMAAKTGYAREEALHNAGLYNRLFGGPPAPGNRHGLDGVDAEDWINQGYDDYVNGRWTSEPSN
jgi:hypothetical protein